MAEIAAGSSQANVMVSLRKDFICFSPHLYDGSDRIDEPMEAIDGIVAAA